MIKRVLVLCACICVFALFGCQGKQTVDVKAVCSQAAKVCSLADQLCALDPKVAELDACVKRSEVCGPAVAFCAPFLASPAPVDVTGVATPTPTLASTE